MSYLLICFFFNYREDGLTIGVYLVIEKVSEEDYGDYICRISKPDKSISMNVTLEERGKFMTSRHIKYITL